MKVHEINISYSNPVYLECEKVATSRESHSILKTLWDDDITYRESFLVLHLNTANKIKGVHRLSKGGMNATMADIRLILAPALKGLASALIIAHNHPSGNAQPSQADKILTKKVVEAAKIMDLTILDHIILTPEDEYFSFADEGMLF